MAKVEVYTADYCPYCTHAKNLLNAKGIAFEEITLDDDPEGRVALAEKSGGRKTIPQIFIDGKHIGGFDDLKALNEKGELDQLLKA